MENVTGREHPLQDSTYGVDGDTAREFCKAHLKVEFGEPVPFGDGCE
jgi:hypothetical protein